MNRVHNILTLRRRGFQSLILHALNYYSDVGINLIIAIRDVNWRRGGGWSVVNDVVCCFHSNLDSGFLFS